jgi:hypothetical protein
VIFDRRTGLPLISKRAVTEKAVTPYWRDIVVIRA